MTGWGVPRLTGLMTTIDGKTAPTRNILPPLPTTAIAPVNPACFPLWVDPADDDNYAFDVRGAGMNPQLDLLQGDLVVSPDGKTLKAKLTINDLSTATAPGSTANEYYLSWTYNKVTYFANAEVDITGATTFHDGTVDATGPSQTYNNANTVTGSIGSGRRGVVEIDVPVADVGSPATVRCSTSPAGLSAALGRRTGRWAGRCRRSTPAGRSTTSRSAPLRGRGQHEQAGAGAAAGARRVSGCRPRARRRSGSNWVWRRRVWRLGWGGSGAGRQLGQALHELRLAVGRLVLVDDALGCRLVEALHRRLAARRRCRRRPPRRRAPLTSPAS